MVTKPDMSRYTCKKTHQITDVNNIVNVLPYLKKKILIYYRIEAINFIEVCFYSVLLLFCCTTEGE